MNSARLSAFLNELEKISSAWDRHWAKKLPGGLKELKRLGKVPRTNLDSDAITELYRSRGAVAPMATGSVANVRRDRADLKGLKKLAPSGHGLEGIRSSSKSLEGLEG